MNRNIRNIIIVALFTVGGGWLGIWLNNVSGNTQPPMQSLGALVWLTSHALSGIFLRAFGGDGWKDSGFGLIERDCRRRWIAQANHAFSIGGIPTRRRGNIRTTHTQTVSRCAQLTVRIERIGVLEKLRGVVA